jgi:hypothetical protein
MARSGGRGVHSLPLLHPYGQTMGAANSIDPGLGVLESGNLYYSSEYRSTTIALPTTTIIYQSHIEQSCVEED